MGSAQPQDVPSPWAAGRPEIRRLHFPAPLPGYQRQQLLLPGKGRSAPPAKSRYRLSRLPIRPTKPRTGDLWETWAPAYPPSNWLACSRGTLGDVFLGVFRACACVKAGRQGHSGVSVAPSVGPSAEDTFSAEAALGPFRPAGSPRPRRKLRAGRVSLDPSASPSPGALRTVPLYPRPLFLQVSSPRPLPLGAPGQGGEAGPETPGVAPTSARAWGPRGVGGRGPGGDGCAGSGFTVLSTEALLTVMPGAAPGSGDVRGRSWRFLPRCPALLLPRIPRTTHLIGNGS